MIIEEALYAQIQPIVNLYPLLVPQDVGLPAAAYQRISGPRVAAHDGPSGLAFGRWQITVNAADYAACNNICQSIRQAVDAVKGVWGGTGGVTVHESRVENELDGYSQLDKIYTRRLDVLIWYQEV